MTSKRYVVAVLTDDEGLIEVHDGPEPLTWRNGPEALEAVRKVAPDGATLVLVPVRELP